MANCKIVLDSVGVAEDAVIRLLHTRLMAGRDCYGPLDPDDGRDWMAEGVEEYADGAIYMLIRLLQGMERNGWRK